MLEKIPDMLEKMPHIYYYVPPCPVCGSRRTGRYVRGALLLEDDKRYVMAESLKHGELVRIADRFVPINNVYCEDCGHEWHYLVTAKRMTGKELAEEKKARGTNARFENYIENNPKKKKSIFGRIFEFLP